MNLTLLLKQLADKDIQLSLGEGNNLKLTFAKDGEGLSQELRETILANKAALIQWIKGSTTTVNTRNIRIPDIIPIDAHRKNLPLSFAQQRLWFLEQLNGEGKSTYCIPGAMALHGDINLAFLLRAIELMVIRHESLRTQFKQKDGEPHQQIVQENVTPAAKNYIDGQVIDLSDRDIISFEAAELQLQSILDRETKTGFDLTKGQPFRYRIVLLSRTHLVLFFNFHHIISDGWSNNVYMQELLSLYQKMQQGLEPALEPLRIHYKDFACWQRDWLNSTVKDELLAFWKTSLKGWQRLDVPTDMPRTALTEQRGRTHHTYITPATKELLLKLAASESTTLFTVLLSAFYIFLAKICNQKDIVIGSDVAGRSKTELEKLVGFFVNQIVLRGDLSGDPGFPELLTRIKAMTIDAYAHQDLPFDTLVDAVLHDRTPSQSPFFSTKFIYQNSYERVQSFAGLTINEVPLPYGHARFDMCWSLVNTDSDLKLSIEYNFDLFLPETIESFCQQYFTLLDEIAKNPTRKISDYALVNPRIQPAYYQYPPLAELQDPVASVGCFVEHYASTTPAAVAIVDAAVIAEDGIITYEQLHRRSNCLANLLASMGAGIESRIGVCLNSSHEYLIAFCAASKLGATVVPFDVTWPEERTSTILRIAVLDVFISNTEILDNLPAYELSFTPLICLGEMDSEIYSQSNEFVVVPPRAEQLAYIIFTSGTTGEPKGVMVTHSGLAALAQEQSQRFALTSSSRVLQFASLGFDASIWEIIMAISCGGSLYCASRDFTMPGKALINFVNKYGITHATLPPSSLALMQPESMPSLQYIVVAGEACKDEILRPWHQCAKVFNAYGPSETTVCATIENYLPEYDGFNASIGHSIQGSEIYLVSADGMLVGPGVVGELLVGGLSPARGYWQDPWKTAQSFIPDAYSGRAGARLYRTGDLAKLSAGGRISFLGRADQQIKLRGFRIELKEIERHLMRDSAVHEAVVILSKDAEPAILAYVVANETLNTTQLKNSLLRSLPKYMMPQSITKIDHVPLTVNGKIDTASLPVSAVIEEEEGSDDLPLGKYEEIVSNVWQQLLNKENISRRRNFFDSGGHSLLLVQVQERLNSGYNIDISVADLFKYPTIESLARFLTSDNLAGAASANTLTENQFDNISERAQKRKHARTTRKGMELS